MRKRASKTGKRPDINEIASAIVEIATDGTSDAPTTDKPVVGDTGRNGGFKGGKARAEKLSAERRREVEETGLQSGHSRPAPIDTDTYFCVSFMG